MDKFERQAERNRKSSLRTGLLFGIIGLGVICVALGWLGSITDAPPGFWRNVAIGALIALLLLRQIRRALARVNRDKPGQKPRSAQPDPKSTLNLH